MSKRKLRRDKRSSSYKWEKVWKYIFLITLFNLLLQSSPLTARLDVAKYQLMQFFFPVLSDHQYCLTKRLLTKNNWKTLLLDIVKFFGLSRKLKHYYFTIWAEQKCNIRKIKAWEMQGSIFVFSWNAGMAIWMKMWYWKNKGFRNEGADLYIFLVWSRAFWLRPQNCMCLDGSCWDF